MKCAHVTPIDDTIDHDLSSHCPCHPVLSRHPAYDGDENKLMLQYRHNALDGRKDSDMTHKGWKTDTFNYDE